MQVVPRHLRGDRAAYQPRATAEHGHRLRRDRLVLEQPLLRRPALMPELLQLPRVDAVPGRLELLLDPARQRQVHVVAAQQDVLAHGHSAEHERAVLLAGRDEAEVGGPAADVAHQDEVADLDALAPALALGGQPGIQGGLRLLEQAHAGQSGLRGGPQGQLARLLVEGRRHGHQHLVVPQRSTLGPADVLPRVGQVRQVACRRGNGRHAPDVLGRLPRQDRPGAIHAGVGQPGLGRGHEARGVLGAALARELADDGVGALIPRERGGAGREILRTRDEQKRGHEGRRGDLSRID